MTDAIIGHGTAMQLEDSPGAGTYTTIAEVLAINGLSLGADTVEVTNMDSTNKFREYIGGLRDGGEVSFDINWIIGNSTHDVTTGVAQDWNDSEHTTRNFKVIWPDAGATVWTFSGIFTNFGIGDPFDGAMTASVTIKVTGQPTFA
jgi:predicted secreted protein